MLVHLALSPLLLCFTNNTECIVFANCRDELCNASKKATKDLTVLNMFQVDIMEVQRKSYPEELDESTRCHIIVVNLQAQLTIIVNCYYVHILL